MPLVNSVKSYSMCIYRLSQIMPLVHGVLRDFTPLNNGLQFCSMCIYTDADI